MSSVNIADKVMSTGMDQISSLEQKIADKINEANASESGLDQVALIELQQMTSQYTNTISLMTAMLKDLRDSDSEVIRNT